MDRVYKRRCSQCLQPFNGTGGGARFCSPECYFDFYVHDQTKQGCWEWQGVRRSHNYGVMRHGRKNVIHAHRFSYERFVGPIPAGLFVLHTCDNPPCVNPSHLFTGTKKDNTDDMVKKGRHGKNYNRGTSNQAAKLTEAIVKKIRVSSLPREQLAAKFKVSLSAIRKIQNRQTWKHVTPA